MESRHDYKVFQKYFPAPAVDYCYELLKRYRFRFVVNKNRQSKLGDYRYIPESKSDKITVNGDLNPYAFLITYLHEVAHLQTRLEYGEKAAPHGQAWKTNFKKILSPVLTQQVFPESILAPLKHHMKNPKASTATDTKLQKALFDSDTPANGEILLQDLEEGKEFRLNKRVFRKGKLRRTRYRCTEIKSKRDYLVSKAARVIPL